MSIALKTLCTAMKISYQEHPQKPGVMCWIGTVCMLNPDGDLVDAWRELSGAEVKQLLTAEGTSHSSWV